MATTDRLTPWNSKYNFCALVPNKDFFPSGPHRDLELAGVTNASLFANECIRKLMGGTLGRVQNKAPGVIDHTHVAFGIEKITKPTGDFSVGYRPTDRFLPTIPAGLPSFGRIIPEGINEAYLACPFCNHMNHFLRSRDNDKSFECAKCHFK